MFHFPEKKREKNIHVNISRLVAKKKKIGIILVKFLLCDPLSFHDMICAGLVELSVCGLDNVSLLLERRGLACQNVSLWVVEIDVH